MDTSQIQRPIPVAQYLRMSTEHQRYSTTNQAEAIATYAEQHGMEVVRTYEDSGRSGLTLAERPALQELLDDVHSPERRFKAVIAFDVSRWGRFQDVDESAYYEFVCRRAGVEVVYCAEPFGDVPGPMAVVIKSVKRAMAAEFSRELGRKVHAGKCLLARRGYHMGGMPNFGLQRVLVSEDGEVKGRLKRNELKSIQTDRVLLEPGDPLDVALVRHIFGLFVRRRLREADVARALNWSCYPSRSGLYEWSGQTVRDILRNERYAGNLVYNRRSCSLKTPWVKNPPEAWIRKDHCFAGIVSQATFDEAQRLLLRSKRHFWSTEETLDIVRRVYAEYGTVSPRLLQLHGFPYTTLFITHFGSLADACDAAGIEPSDRLKTQRRQIITRRTLKLELLEALAEKYRAAGMSMIWWKNSRRACVDGGPTISVRTVQVFRSTRNRSDYWLVTPDLRILPDYAVIARVAEDSSNILDYFMLPAGERRNIFVGINGKAAHEWAERYRYETLDDVFRVLEMERLRGRVLARRLPVNLAKRRRRMLGIKKRSGRSVFYPANAER